MTNDREFGADPALALRAEPALRLDASRIGQGGGCRNCADAAWVCENHLDRPWGGMTGAMAACECGAGAPCPVCNDIDKAGLRAEVDRWADLAESLFDQLDHGWGCTCTFPAVDCCGFSRAERMIDARKAAIAMETQSATTAGRGPKDDSAGLNEASPDTSPNLSHGSLPMEDYNND